MKATQARLLLTFTTIACVFLSAGCKDCPSCTSVKVDLYPLPAQTAQPVVAVFQQQGGSTISCTWTRSNASRDPSWNCAKDSAPETSSPEQFFFELSNSSRIWELSLQGPSGSAKFDVSPGIYDPDPEAWPGTCTCDGFKLEITREQFASVGVQTSSSNAADAGTDAG